MNYKGKLLEVLKELGVVESRLKISDRRLSEQYFQSSASIDFPDGRQLSGTGESNRKKDAQQDACAQILDQLGYYHPDLLIDWTEVMVEAQVGDALLKLCAYRSQKLPTAAEGSYWLQRIESDAHMVNLFDRLQREGHPDLAIFGSRVGNKRKASWIEALLARHFANRILRDDTAEAFEDMMNFMDE